MKLVLKKSRIYGTEFTGFVDLGSETDLIYSQENMEDISVQATHCLMYILVSINGHIKISIAFYFIDALSGVQKKILVNNA